jgi:hypothetical protein
MNEPEKTLWDIDCPAGPCVCSKPFADHEPDANGKHWFRRFGDDIDIHESCYDDGDALWKLAVALWEQNRRSLYLENLEEARDLFTRIYPPLPGYSEQADSYRNRIAMIMAHWPKDEEDNGE